MGGLVVGGVVDVVEVLNAEVVGVLVVGGVVELVVGVLEVGGVVEVGAVVESSEVVAGEEVVGGKEVVGTVEPVSGVVAVEGGLVGELVVGCTLVVDDAGRSDVLALVLELLLGLLVLVLLDMMNARRFKRGISL